MVTSPGGTSAAALHELESGRLRTVLSEAVWAAYRRTVELGDQLEASVVPRDRAPERRLTDDPRRTATTDRRPARPANGAARRDPLARPARARARPVGRRGGPVGSDARDLGRSGRRGLAPARAPRHRTPAGRPGRSPSTSATSPTGRSSRSTTRRRAIETGVWPSDTRLRRRQLRHVQRAPARTVGVDAARRDPRPACEAARPRLLEVAQRLSPETIRSDDGVGLGLPGPPRPLPRPPRGHRAVDRRTATAGAPPADADRPHHAIAQPDDRGDRRGRRRRASSASTRATGSSPTPPRPPERASSSRSSLRGGYPTQLTASEKPVSDPQWSPDGRRLAFVRDDEIWVVEADGSRLTRVVGKPGGGRAPRWSPDGHRLAFLSRRRGWTQIWLIDAPGPAPRPAGDRAEAAATDRPDRDRRRRRRVRVVARRRAGSRSWPSAGRTSTETAQIALVDVATGDDAGRGRRAERRRRRPAGCRDGSLLYVSDADGWFQVVRLTADGHDRIVLTERRARARRAVRRRRARRRCRRRTAAASSTSRSTTACRTSSSATWPAAAAPKRGRGRPPKTPRTVAAAADRQPDQPVGRRLASRSAGWPTARGSRRSARRETGAAGPVAAAGAGRRPRRRATAPGHRFAAGRPRAPRSRPAASRPRERVAVTARDGLRVEGTLWRPTDGDRQARRHARARRSSTRTAARPGRRSARFQPFKQLLVARGLRVPRRRLPRLDRLRPGVPASPTTTSGATPTSTTSSTPRAGPPSSPGRTAGSRSTAARTAATWSCARSSRSRRCGGPASTCTATRRSPRATATATGSAGSTSTR